MAYVLADLYEWLMFLHIVAAMAWVGGLIILTVLAANVLRSGEPEALNRFVVSLRVLGPRVLAPATVLVIGLGIWMVIESNAWDFGQTWILVAIALFAAAFLIGAVFQSRAAIKGERAATAGYDQEAVRQLRRWSWGMRLILVILLVATWDMVFKPGA